MYKLTLSQIKKAANLGAKALFEYCLRNNIRYVVTGSSGGLDSAVTLAFADKAVKLARKQNFSLTSVGLILPCHSKPDAERLGRLAIKKFHAEEIRLELGPTFDFLFQHILEPADSDLKALLERTGGQEALTEWDWSRKIALGNTKVRLRMMCGTYHVARMLKGMVLSTDNLSEFWMGFWTICGDVGDFGIIQQIMKGLELYDVARYLEVPQEIIEAKPDDGLGIAGGDEDQIGASYPVVDKIMVSLIQQDFNPDGELSQLNKLPSIKDTSADLVKKIARRALLGAYKRKGTIVLSRQDLGLPDVQCIQF